MNENPMLYAIIFMVILAVIFMVGVYITRWVLGTDKMLMHMRRQTELMEASHKHNLEIIENLKLIYAKDQ